MSEQDEAEKGAESAKRPGSAPAPAPVRASTNYAGPAAASVVTAVLFLLAGAIIGTLATELGTGPDVWKARVRLMSLSAQGQYGAVLVTLGLLLGLSLLRAAGRTGLRALVVVGTVAAAVWLVILIVLNIYVDITKITPADIATGVVLGDLAALVMAAAAGIWAFSLATGRRS